MITLMKNYEDQTYALMCITTGFMFLCHGATKFMEMQEVVRPWHIQWVAAPIELIGGALVMFGLFTVPAAFLCVGMAAAAYWVGHFTPSYFSISLRRVLVSGAWERPERHFITVSRPFATGCGFNRSMQRIKDAH